MKKSTLLLLGSGVMLSFSGCASSNSNVPLLFGQFHTVGFSIGGSAANQGVDLTLGYKDQDIAIIPVAVKQANGDMTALRGKQKDIKKEKDKYEDGSTEEALSVLGQFEMNGGGSGKDSGDAKVRLGKFFATGLAAKRLADGFAHALDSGCKASDSSQAKKLNNQ